MAKRGKSKKAQAPKLTADERLTLRRLELIAPTCGGHADKLSAMRAAIVREAALRG